MNTINPINKTETVNISIDKSYTYLDSNERPDEIKHYITEVFNEISKEQESNWKAYNGATRYHICQIDEYHLIKKIIQQAPSDQKEFNFLDIGAGNFDWNNGLAKFINAQEDIASDIKVNIIGVRGEKYLGDRVVKNGKATVYNLGAFKIEDIYQQFKEMGLDLENNVDLMITNWTFRHLVDPLGTFVQAYKLLKPMSGLFLFDGFAFLTEKAELTPDSIINNMLDMLFLSNERFINTNYPSGGTFDHFILQKSNADSCKLPYQYKKLHSGIEGLQIASKSVTEFDLVEYPKTEMDDDLDSLNESNTLLGSKKLYNWLEINQLIRK